MCPKLSEHFGCRVRKPASMVLILAPETSGFEPSPTCKMRPDIPWTCHPRPPQDPSLTSRFLPPSLRSAHWQAFLAPCLPVCELEQDTLNNTVLMSNLSIDFARALKDLAAIMNDLKHLATLGDLPISLHDSTTLRVRFPGCDADTVESLCRELNIKRGMVGQDENFDTRNGTEMALLFPFAPSNSASEAGFEMSNRPTKRVKKDRLEWHEMLTPPQGGSAGFSHLSATSQSHDAFEMIDEALGQNPWMSSPSGYSSLHESELLETDDPVVYFFQPQRNLSVPGQHEEHSGTANGYEGLEGIYRFIEQCDRVRS